LQIPDSELAEPKALAEAEAMVESETRYEPVLDDPPPSDDAPPPWQLRVRFSQSGRDRTEVGVD